LACGVIAVGLTTFLPAVSASAAQAPVGLGTADSFAVLSGAGITNTGATTIVGDVGSFPNPAQTGFGTVTLTGTNHAGDAVTQQAKTDLTTAYNQAAFAGPPTAVATELGGTTLTPGVYHSATLGITGTLTLNTLGDPSAVFIFQAESTLITAANSAVTVLNGGTACNVYWKVPSSATLGTDSHLVGTVLASTSIQATTGATIQGRLLASTASVTLDHNTITNQPCAAAITTTTTGGSSTSTTTAPGGSTSTTAPVGSTTTTTPLGATATTLPGGATATTLPGGSTATTQPGGSVTTTTANSTSPPASTPPTTTRPPLPRTGSDSRLPLIGAVTIALGFLLLGMSKRINESR
jgi:hypothetical protein